MRKTQEQLDEELMMSLLPTMRALLALRVCLGDHDGVDMFSKIFPSKMFCEAKDEDEEDETMDQ